MTKAAWSLDFQLEGGGLFAERTTPRSRPGFFSLFGRLILPFESICDGSLFPRNPRFGLAASAPVPAIAAVKIRHGGLLNKGYYLFRMGAWIDLNTAATHPFGQFPNVQRV